MEALEAKLSTLLQAQCQRLDQLNAEVTETSQLQVSTASRHATEQINEMGRLSDKFDKATLSAQEQASQRQASISRSLADLLQHLHSFGALAESIPRENRVLKRLYFTSMHYREGNIDKPASDTFCWMLDQLDGRPAGSPERDNQPSYPGNRPRLGKNRGTEEAGRRDASISLQKALARDSQTFFVYGKAGCGKSTLMKFLMHNSRVREELAVWAGNRALVIVGMFFWRSDDRLQKSLEGFYRAILYHTLRQCPDLIMKLFPGQEATGMPDAVEFQLRDLEEAFHRLIRYTDIETHRFCYMIDGLDEYEGESLKHKQLAETLSRWARSAAVKIVCSARPDTIFRSVFAASGSVVDLGRLNRSDLVEYARTRFDSALSDPEFAAGRAVCQEMVETLVRKAEGVFVWIVVATGSLINGILEGDDDEKTLHQRVKDFPMASNLGDMFRQMLARIDRTPHVRQRSNILLYLVAHNTADKPLNGLLCSWLEDLDWLQDTDRSDFPFDRPMEPYSVAEWESRVAKCRKLLHLLTQGLLEMQSARVSPLGRGPRTSFDLYVNCRVEFHHRSIRDFLRDQWEFHDKVFGSREEEIQTYCRLYIAEAQFMPWPGRNTHHISHPSAFNWISRCVGFHAAEGPTPPFRFLRQLERIATMPIPQRLNVWSRWNHRFPAVGFEHEWWPNLGLFESLPTERGSFLHWAAYVGLSAYVRERLATDGVSLADVDTPRANLLLSASFGDNVELMRYLFSVGGRPSDTIECRFPKHNPSAQTVWLISLWDFAHSLSLRTWTRHLDKRTLQGRAEVLEGYLRAGADPIVWFYLEFDGETDAQGKTTVVTSESVEPRLPPDSVVVVDLRLLLDVIHLPNHAALNELLSPAGQQVPSLALRSNPEFPAAPSGGGVPSSGAPWGRGYLPCPSFTHHKLLDKKWKITALVASDGEKLIGGFQFRVW